MTFTEILDTHNGKVKRWVSELREGKVYVVLIHNTDRVHGLNVEVFNTIWTCEACYHHMVRTSHEPHERVINGTFIPTKKVRK